MFSSHSTSVPNSQTTDNELTSHQTNAQFLNFLASQYYLRRPTHTATLSCSLPRFVWKSSNIFKNSKVEKKCMALSSCGRPLQLKKLTYAKQLTVFCDSLSLPVLDQTFQGNCAFSSNIFGTKARLAAICTNILSIEEIIG